MYDGVVQPQDASNDVFQGNAQQKVLLSMQVDYVIQTGLSLSMALLLGLQIGYQLV